MIFVSQSDRILKTIGGILRRDSFRQVAVIIATLITLTVNILANAIPINGLTTGAISDQFKVYFIPAGYVFSIWGLIYLALIGYTIYQALPSKREDATLRSIGGWYIASCLANSAWIFLWHYQLFLLSLVVMVLLLVSLLVVYVRLNVGLEKTSIGMRVLVNLPFSIYLSWVTVATIANFTDVLDYYKFSILGANEKTWAVIMIVVALIVGEMIAFNRRDLVFLGVQVWAFIGIAVKNTGVSTVYEAALAASVIVMVIIVPTSIYKIKKFRQRS